MFAFFRHPYNICKGKVDILEIFSPRGDRRAHQSILLEYNMLRRKSRPEYNMATRQLIDFRSL